MAILSPALRTPMLGPLAFACALASCGDGCGRARDRQRLEATLAALPADTRLVAWIDVEHVRRSSLWQRLAVLAEEDPEYRKLLAGLAARTGFDPARQLRWVAAAFPEDARNSGKYALVVQGEGLDRSKDKLVAYAREEQARRGGRIEARPHAGFTLFGTVGGRGAAGFFPGSNRLVLGAGGWAEAIAGLAAGHPGQGASAVANAELADLCARVAPGAALWFAAILPPDLRRDLGVSAQLDAGRVERLAAGLRLDRGFAVEVIADLPRPDEARALAARIENGLREARRSPQVLVLGLGHYLDAAKATSDGATARLSLALDDHKLEDLLTRLEGTARAARNQSRKAKP